MWVPTVVLWVSTPLLLGYSSAVFTVLHVVGWSVDPVLALFLGGFALAAAATAQGVDRTVAAVAIGLSRVRPIRLVVMVEFAMLLISMWMSNVAAAALMIASLRPVLDGDDSPSGSLRRPPLVAIALAANVGGIAAKGRSRRHNGMGIAVHALEQRLPHGIERSHRLAIVARWALTRR